MINSLWALLGAEQNSKQDTTKRRFVGGNEEQLTFNNSRPRWSISFSLHTFLHSYSLMHNLYFTSLHRAFRSII